MKKSITIISLMMLIMGLTGCNSNQGQHRSQNHSKISNVLHSHKSSSSHSNASSSSNSVQSSSLNSTSLSYVSSNSTSTIQPQTTARSVNDNQNNNNSNNAQKQANNTNQENQQYTEQGHYPTWKKGNTYYAKLPNGKVMEQTTNDGSDPGQYMGDPQVQYETDLIQNGLANPDGTLTEKGKQAGVQGW